jgi:hypothetical protein
VKPMPRSSLPTARTDTPASSLPATRCAKRGGRSFLFPSAKVREEKGR